ncbi:hypothetical protein HNQ51_002770 [Inhella inkyongensis]|uniref:Uncharacterized protein n=1 Tax=Inhella inkyongensis TaxID=392593 RepID=A0A840SAC9_9BURK|nr:hypothetical protein [Inhella inkyongensis]MBB5205451.1 hypothetical protein [Inhella inkyongensis]
MLHSHLGDPFALLLDPEGVAREVAASERLARLRSRIYRPLDRPLIPLSGSAASACADFDAWLDSELPEDEAMEVDIGEPH